MSIHTERPARSGSTAGPLVLAGAAMIGIGAMLWLLVGDTIDWIGALFLAWGVAGGVICFGQAAIEALHLSRRVPVRIPVEKRKR